MAFTDYKRELDKISTDEEKVLRLYSMNEDLPVNALVSLILNEKVNKPIPSVYLSDLKIRNYVTEAGVITEEGMEYINSESTKERVKKIVGG